MFIFIAGLQPRTRDLDSPPRTCPACNRPALRLRRTDQYFSLFFIPLFRVKQGEPFAACGGCGAVFASADPLLGEKSSGTSRCRSCGHSVEPDFRFCPACGSRV